MTLHNWQVIGETGSQLDYLVWCKHCGSVATLDWTEHVPEHIETVKNIVFPDYKVCCSGLKNH